MGQGTNFGDVPDSGFWDLNLLQFKGGDQSQVAQSVHTTRCLSVFYISPFTLKKKDVLQQAQLRTKLLFFFYSVSLYVLCWLLNNFNDFTSSWMSMLLTWEGKRAEAMVEIAARERTLRWCFSTPLVLSSVMECLLRA